MKCIALLLSAYLMVLSFLPCSDRQECDDRSSETVAVVAAHDTHEHTREHCTPLCHCACCNIVVAADAVYGYTLQQTVFQINNTNLLYKSVELKGFQDGIWQPPKHFS